MLPHRLAQVSIILGDCVRLGDQQAVLQLRLASYLPCILSGLIAGGLGIVTQPLCRVDIITIYAVHVF